MSICRITNRTGEKMPRGHNIYGGVLLLALTASPASAQQAPAAPREGYGVGIVFTAMLTGGKILSVRMTAPASEKIAFDFDVGWNLGRSGRHQPSWNPKGLAAAAHLRWLPKGRSENGWSGAIKSGVRFQQSTLAENGTTKQHWTFIPDLLGFTLDRLTESGFRIGAEAGGVYCIPINLPESAIGELIVPMVWASAFGAWTQR